MSNSEYDFECLLQQQASKFSMRAGGENESEVKVFIIADFEFSYDRSRHEGYMVQEGASAQTSIRWPFHRIAAASWQVMRFLPGLETPQIEPPVVLSSDNQTEAEMVKAFFDAVIGEPTAKLVSWGGETRDLAVLRRMAEENDLLLPPQIAELSPLACTRIDLCDATAVRAERVHLAEYAAACSIPAKPSPSKSVGKYVEHEDWVKVEEQVLADVMTTTVILILHLTARGVVTCDRIATIMKLAQSAATAFPSNAFVTRTFLPWARARQAAAGLRGTVYRPE
ncbi:hypothetical protein HME9302_02577 [Alteripontixanthobacter maritimus]|uniref:Predicted 3'-5' exonuclease PolB-like domain-containing protein n=1 Tax=Alteripontixanthobacter maritimus TaxID=2161824 RepID=A0A369QCR0_9SPHN|nr:hypothetical protein [Alteripontixanthobacter maritimus]RDC61355.1 hypothetical protein HME9302_02577 [Alteripontixanthobacter maritimus]